VVPSAIILQTKAIRIMTGNVALEAVQPVLELDGESTTIVVIPLDIKWLSALLGRHHPSSDTPPYLRRELDDSYKNQFLSPWLSLRLTCHPFTIIQTPVQDSGTVSLTFITYSRNSKVQGTLLL
jgi:hypothetical protein